MSKEWKKFKKVSTERTSVPMWVFYIICIAWLGTIIFADVNGQDEGYWDGYNQALEDEQEQDLYTIWLTYDYDTRVESFWSTIMWDVSNHTTEIFMVLTLFLLLLGIRI